MKTFSQALSQGKQKHFLYVDGSIWQGTRNNKY